MAVPGEQLRLRLDYRGDLFDRAGVAAMADRLVRLLEAAADDPDRAIGGLDILAPAERHTILRAWNDTARAVPSTTLPQLFEAQVARSPDAVAVVFEDTTLTYAELDARANQLAHHLRARGVGPEVVVGLCIERSPEMIVGLLGILKAGGAYLPLDPAYPTERLAFMIEDAGAPVIVTQAALRNRIPQHGNHIIRLDADAADIERIQRPRPQTTSLPKTPPMSSTHQVQQEYLKASPSRISGIAQSCAAGRHRSTLIRTTGGMAQFAPFSFDFAALGDFCRFSWRRLISVPFRRRSTRDL